MRRAVLCDPPGLLLARASSRLPRSSRWFDRTVAQTLEQPTLAIRRSQREVGDDPGPLVQVVQRAQERARVAPSLVGRPGREGAHHEHVADAHSHGAAQRLGLVEQGPGPQV